MPWSWWSSSLKGCRFDMKLNITWHSLHCIWYGLVLLEIEKIYRIILLLDEKSFFRKWSFKQWLGWKNGNCKKSSSSWNMQNLFKFYRAGYLNEIYLSNEDLVDLKNVFENTYFQSLTQGDQMSFFPKKMQLFFSKNSKNIHNYLFGLISKTWSLHRNTFLVVPSSLKS